MGLEPDPFLLPLETMSLVLTQAPEAWLRLWSFSLEQTPLA